MTAAALAFARVEGQTLELCLGPGEQVYSVDWVFPFVSSARWAAEQGRVLVTATPVTRRAPSARAGDRGDLALLTWKPGEDAWQLLYQGYAHDAVCLSGGGFAVHRGGGLTFLDPSGRKVRELKAGRFNWGPPSLSVRPAGDLVAWIRWRGDDRRLHLENAAGTISVDLRTSVHRYAWADDDTIVYYLGTGLRLLDIASGRSRALAKNLAALIGGADVPGADPEYLRRPATDARVQDLQTVGEQLWFILTLPATGVARQRWFTGLFAKNTVDGPARLITHVAPGERIESFTALPDGSAELAVAHYEGTRITQREQRQTGPLAPFLAQGWWPLRNNGEPEFGFHALP